MNPILPSGSSTLLLLWITSTLCRSNLQSLPISVLKSMISALLAALLIAAKSFLYEAWCFHLMSFVLKAFMVMETSTSSGSSAVSHSQSVLPAQHLTGPTDSHQLMVYAILVIMLDYLVLSQRQCIRKINLQVGNSFLWQSIEFYHNNIGRDFS